MNHYPKVREKVSTKIELNKRTTNENGWKLEDRKHVALDRRKIKVRSNLSL